MNWFDALRHTVGTTAVLAGLVVTPLALSHLDDDQRIVETQPVREVEVLAVLNPQTWHSQLTTVIVRHPETQVPTSVDGADKLHALPAAHTFIPVVVDPADRTRVLTAGVDWSPTWFDYTTTVAATALPAVTIAALMFSPLTRRRNEV